MSDAGTDRPPYLAPEHIRRINPYAPGPPVEDLQAELGVDRLTLLGANENPYGPCPAAAQAIREAAARLNLYPDGGGLHLRKALARRFGLAPEQVVLGAGSGELVDLLCHAFVSPRQRVAFSALAFVQYRLSAAAVDAELVEVPPAPGDRCDPAALARAARGARLCFLDNPNNPTGTYVTRAELSAYLEAAGSDVLTVVDQAYQEYVAEPDYPDALDDLKAGRNVVVLGTFSKIYGLAGARIGYGLGAAEVLRQMEAVRPPFNANALGQAAARAALADGVYVAECRRRNLEQRRWLAGELAARGFEVTPSIANFLLVRTGRSGDRVYRDLRAQGVVVRPLGGPLLEGAVRITVGTPEDNRRLLAALDRMAESPGDEG